MLPGQQASSPFLGLFPEPETSGYGLAEFRSGHGPLLADAGPQPPSAFRLTGGGREAGGLAREQLPRGSANFRGGSEDPITGRRFGVDASSRAAGSQRSIRERFNQAGEGRGRFQRRRPDNLGPADSTPPRVVGAISRNLSTVLVRFSEAMHQSILNPSLFAISQANGTAEAARLPVHAVAFANQSRTAVKLKTGLQSELRYTVQVVGGRDRAGNAIAAPSRPGLDPARATFAGTPPNVIELHDTDGDGLMDNVELRGWPVTVKNVDGLITTRHVTSDPMLADTDGDGLSDSQEANIRFDPRAGDSDDDQISDYTEFNEVYSNGLDQDTDGDGLDDGSEWGFYLTSPIFMDSDGDQIADADEIIGNRNPRVSDLPRPEIEVGDINLRLNVQYSESNAQERRDLETRATSTTLSASQSQTHSRQYSWNVEAKFEGGFGGLETGWNWNAGASAGFTYNQSEESATEATRSYERSLSTDKEVTKGFTVERNVVGAVMQAAVSLRNVSDLAYRVKNLQVTALIQDPLDHTSLTPVATLLPDNEPEEGYTLGALVKNRGPIIFSNDTIVPSLVESLMANSSGLIFQISNYDVIDENGRNFAFTSQEVVERTGLMVIDYGGASSLRSQVSGEEVDELKPGDETEILRISTAAGRVIDTNGNGQLDGEDRRASFDGAGKEVGISLFDALAAAGMTAYDENTDPMDTLSTEEIQNSYSTILDGEVMKIHRIRGVVNDPQAEKYWQILTPLGIDSETDLKDLILKTDSPISLNFVQDIDEDGLPADVEFLLRTSDQKKDTDGDELDDRFEALIGWTVETPQGRRQVYSSPNRADSNFDKPKPDADSDEDGVPDIDVYDGSDLIAAPDGWDDKNGNFLRDAGEVYKMDDASDYIDYVLDPIRKDTDGDGINDATEVIGFYIKSVTGGDKKFVKKTNPTSQFTDEDTFTDGFERSLNLDPTDGRDQDQDGDGLPDPIEEGGWDVKTINVSTLPFQEGLSTTVLRQSKTDSLDSDEDGLTDYEEFFLKTNPSSKDSDGDGIDDRLEHLGYALGHKVNNAELGSIKTNPLDADTDNDKRSDGDEAELLDVETKRWIIRVDGETPYQVFTNPLVADADFDGLVDGDEFSQKSDPSKYDTDSDGRNDRLEKEGFFNPLIQDFTVTVIVSSLQITKDGDPDGSEEQTDLTKVANPGDFGVHVVVREPYQYLDDSSYQSSSVFQHKAFLKDYRTVFYDNNNVADLINSTIPGDISDTIGVDVRSGTTLAIDKIFTLYSRQRSFVVAKNQTFSIEGVIAEYDSLEDDFRRIKLGTTVFLGGLEGVKATSSGDSTAKASGVFYGEDLLNSETRIQELTFNFTEADNFEYTPGKDGKITGALKMMLIVS